jgi:hypothetical protein
MKLLVLPGTILSLLGAGAGPTGAESTASYRGRWLEGTGDAAAFDPGAIRWRITPTKFGWLYRSADSNITSAWTDRNGNPAGTVSVA